MRGAYIMHITNLTLEESKEIKQMALQDIKDRKEDRKIFNPFYSTFKFWKKKFKAKNSNALRTIPPEQRAKIYEQYYIPFYRSSL